MIPAISVYPSYTKFDETNRLGLWWVLFGALINPQPPEPPKPPKVTGGTGGGRTYVWTHENHLNNDDEETILAAIVAFCLSK